MNLFDSSIDKYMRWFVRQSVKGGRVCAFNQNCKSKNGDDTSKIISEQLNVEGKIYDIIEAYLNYKNKYLELFEKEYESQLNDYGDIDEEEKNIHNAKLSKLSIHQLIKQKHLREILWDFDAVSSYPSDMCDVMSVYSRIESVFAYTQDMNDELVKKFTNRTLTQGSVFWKFGITVEKI